MNFLSSYANVYNAIHDSRDFGEDIRIAMRALDGATSEKISEMNVLDFGCGTGRHVQEISKHAKSTTGYDRSDAMIQIAKMNFPTAIFTSDLANLDGEFDLVLSLFDVISYQAESEELDFFLQSVSRCLKPGGHSIFDGWHTPGVLVSPPEYREKKLQVGGRNLLRKVSPINNDKSDTYRLRITVEDTATAQLVSDEIHLMRALDFSTLQKAAMRAGMNILSFSDRENPVSKPESHNYWRFMAVLQRQE